MPHFDFGRYLHASQNFRVPIPLTACQFSVFRPAYLRRKHVGKMPRTPASKQRISEIKNASNKPTSSPVARSYQHKALGELHRRRFLPHIDPPPSTSKMDAFVPGIPAELRWMQTSSPAVVWMNRFSSALCASTPEPLQPAVAVWCLFKLWLLDAQGGGL